MTARQRKSNPVYALVSACHAHGFGHIYIHIHEKLGYTNDTLRISCQTSDNYPGESYAWTYGVASYDAVLNVTTLKNGYWLMYRIGRILEKEQATYGAPVNFAEYALRILRAAGVRRVHLLPGVNPGYCSEIQTLPTLDPLKQGDVLQAELESMEQAIMKM